MTRETDSRGDAARPVPDFEPVAVRRRHDGWTPDRQLDFIEALSQCGCVEHACQRVGMSPASAYALRQRIDAQSFRLAWDAALEYAVHRLSEAAFSRALNGVARPVFFQGEQIGERRYFDERLTQFLLRYHDPVRYGRWNDQSVFERHPEGPALVLSKALNRLSDDAHYQQQGALPPEHPPFPFRRQTTFEKREAELQEARERHAEARGLAGTNARRAACEADRRGT